jgi:hypothetical protein
MNRSTHIGLLAILLVSAASLPAQDRGLEALKWLSKLVESGRDYYAFDTAKMTDAEFEAFFRSERFETTMRRSEAGGGIGLGFGDVGLTFGGEGESENAWTLWSDNRLKSGWNFKNRTNTVIRVSALNREFISMLPEIIAATTTAFRPDVGRREELALEVEADENVVFVKLRWTATTADDGQGGVKVLPIRITDIVASGARLDEAAKRSLVSKVLVQQEQTLRLPWIEESGFATVLLVSDQRHVLTGYVKRPRAREAMLSIKVSRGDKWQDIAVLSDAFWTKRGRDEHRDSGWAEAGWPSHERYLAAYTRSVLTCGPGRRLVGVDCKGVPGQGNAGWCAVETDRDSPSDSANKVARSVKTWGPNAQFTLSARLQEKVTQYVTEQQLVVFKGDEVTVSLAKNVVEAMLVTHVDGRMVWVKVGEERGRGMELKGTASRQGDSITDYTYRVGEQ